MFESLMTIPGPLLDGSRATGAGYAVGVDGGATKTVAAVLKRDGLAMGFGRSGPANIDAVGVGTATASIREALDEALASAQIDAEAVGTAVVGLAGTPSDDLMRRLESHYGFREWYFVNDVVIAWASGCWLDPGVAVISGTGSHVFGVSADGKCWRTGGWGHILGDEGSGYWLGLHGMKAALAYRDGSGPETALMDAAVSFYHLGAVEELQELTYGKPLTKREIAAFTGEVEKAAEAGDAVALGLFETAARDLAMQAHAPVEQLGLEGKFKIALVGGVFAHGGLLRDPFEQAVREFSPEALFVLPEIPPVGGSLLLALRAENAVDGLDRDVFRSALSAAVE